MMKIITTLIIIAAFKLSVAQNVGIGTTTPTARLHVADSSVLFSAIGSLPVEPSLPPAEGAGRRMMWYADKAAFRTGRVTGTFWDKDSIGNYSVAMGYNSKATNFYSFASGFGNYASGIAAAAIGYNNEASGNYSSAIGYNSKSLNTYTIAIGNNATASGDNGIAIGKNASALGTESLALMGAAAKGNNSIAMMSTANAEGYRSVAIGYNVSAPSYGEVALGFYNTEYTPIAPLATNPLVDQDRLFTIGNGTFTSRSDALVILKNGNAGLGTSTPANKLEVVGKTKTTTLQITNGAATNYVLKSDASGNAAWADVNTITTTSLDKAYDGTGTGLGRSITADAGAVRIDGTDGLVVSGLFGTGKDLDLEVSGLGNRLYYNPKKAAFGVGEMAISNWDPFTMVGNRSIAMGSSALASGNYATAIGYFPNAQGEYGVAIGRSATASGINSLALGRGVSASGDNATAIGYGTTAESFGETAIGLFNTAYVQTSNNSYINSDRLFVIGNGTSNASRSDALIILKNGDVKIGNKGTYLTNMQEGIEVIGSSASVTKDYLIVFPNEFSNASNVRVLAQVVNELPGNADEFIVTVKGIVAAGCTVRVRRIDTASGWGQQLKLHWMAWE